MHQQSRERQKKKYLLWYRIKEYVTENAGESPEILIFQPACRTSLEHCNSKFVALFTNIWCQFKFRRCKRIFAVADKFAVQPDIHSSFHTLKRNKYTFVFQGIVQVKISDVDVYKRQVYLSHHG